VGKRVRRSPDGLDRTQCLPVVVIDSCRRRGLAAT
jgi:hypothetical protein